MAQPITIAETDKFRIEVEYQGETMTLRPIGRIDEDVNFGDALKLILDPSSNVKQLAFDMGRVTDINSCGVREWLFLMERVQAFVSCQFLMVNELFIEQANIVPNLLGKVGTPVFNFSAPYFCAQCEHRIMRVLKTEEVQQSNGQFIFPVFDCEKCGNGLEFDALEEEYFNFLKHSRPKS